MGWLWNERIGRLLLPNCLSDSHFGSDLLSIIGRPNLHLKCKFHAPFFINYVYFTHTLHDRPPHLKGHHLGWPIERGSTIYIELPLTFKKKRWWWCERLEFLFKLVTIVIFNAVNNWWVHESACLDVCLQICATIVGHYVWGSAVHDPSDDAYHGTRPRPMTSYNISKNTERIQVHHWKIHDSYSSPRTFVYSCLRAEKLQLHQLQPWEKLLSDRLQRLHHSHLYAYSSQ